MLKKIALMCLLTLLGLLIAGGTAGKKRADNPSPLSKRANLTFEQVLYIQPDMTVTVLDHQLNGNVVSVRIQITDGRGNPLDVEGNLTPGSISTTFLMGYIPRDGTQYVGITTRVQTSPITGESAEQPSSDSGGLLEQESPGIYRYTFGTPLPDGYDALATHSIGMYLRRDLSEFELAPEVVNEVYNFVPNGDPVTHIRDVVKTQTCNSCHDPLAFHGDRRTEMELCVMCHTAGVVDPDTGNSVDMPEMIHKIHMGANLPSVQAGTPYQIIGFRQSVHDYSDVIYPQSVANCESCHTDAAGAVQHERWLTAPDRDSCGSCHDNVNFATGEGHVNLPQVSDKFCANCHFPQGELEFDASIMGAHTNPLKSTQPAGIQIDITSVENTAPGENPTVNFTVTDKAGNFLDPAEMSRLALTIAGPNTDYSGFTAEDARGAAPNGDGYSYTFNEPISADATGSYTVGAEAFNNATLNAGTVIEIPIRDSAFVETKAFSVTDADPIGRRMVVSEAKCSSCHDQVRAHGTFRQNVEYCITCHNPNTDDSPYRSEEMMPAESVDFKYMIHRLHMGEKLSGEYVVVGFRGSIHDYSHVVYPGDLRNCDSCHVNNSYLLPSPGVLSTPTPYDFFSPMPPTTTACLSCHDSLDAAAHAFTNISLLGEACVSCHGQGAEFDVAKVHAR